MRALVRFAQAFRYAVAEVEEVYLKEYELSLTLRDVSGSL
jgi:hypothetical protein